MKNLSNEKGVFPISVVADLLMVHQRTLRIYDEQDILVPSRSLKGRRLYSLNDIERGKFVQHLTREIGINLAGVKIILHLLKKQKIETTDLAETVKKMGITQEMMEANRIKLGTRGRKKRS